MKIANVQQGSVEWLELRATKFTASEAPSMMGYGWISRDELLKQKATGITPEVLPDLQEIFDKGHAAEESARPLIEEKIGEELYPATAVSDEYDWLLASFDGVTMLEDIVFEHKLWNEGLAHAVLANELPPKYYWQLEQLLLVSGAEKAIFVVSDGTEENMVIMEYFPVPGRKEHLIAGWKQFRRDLESYQSQESKNLPTAEVISSLPAITYQMNGLSVSSNFKRFRQQADSYIERSKQPMETDQDFADGKGLVNVFDSAEKALKAIADRVIAEVSDINQFRTDLMETAEKLRRARLDLNKRVETELNARKVAIQSAARQQLAEHISQLESKLEGLRFPRFNDGIVAATKGKRTLDTFQSAANDAVAAAKIEIAAFYDTAKDNLKTLASEAGEYRFMFADLQQIVFKPAEDFSNLVKSRIAEHKAVEQRKLDIERERIRAEEQEKLEAEQDAQQRASPEVDEKKRIADDELAAAAGIDNAAISFDPAISTPPNPVRTILITESEYLKLLDRERWLSALEAAGVGGWDGCGAASDIYRQMKEVA